MSIEVDTRMCVLHADVVADLLRSAADSIDDYGLLPDHIFRPDVVVRRPDGERIAAMATDVDVRHTEGAAIGAAAFHRV